VLPYTNIIKQSVEIYREALVLPEERPEDVVAEHHHQADFEDVSLRQLATLWRAPVIVTTAVQFFETLASHHPARLRKLHELPSSAVFVDETHAAIPSHL
jgi:CRISPR-associated endonuclease/helicase Cas3